MVAGDVADCSWDCSVIKDLSVDTVGDLLKTYLRVLPEPIIPTCLLQHLLNAEKLRKEPPRLRHATRTIDRIYIDYIRATLCRLPAYNRNLLFYLLQFFSEVRCHPLWSLRVAFQRTNIGMADRDG